MNVVEFAEQISRDLHDGPLQDIFATRLRLDAMAERVPPEIGAELRQLSLLQGRIIGRMRGLDCNRATSDDRPLSEVLADVVFDASIALGFAPHCSIDRRIDMINDATVTNDVANAVRESLSNVARHARATRVVLSVRTSRSGLCFTVCDDGVGIPAVGRRGNGLANLRVRAERNGGSCTFLQADDGGTLVDWRIPAPLSGSDRPRVRDRASSASSRRASMASR